MPDRGFKPPIRPSGDGFELLLEREERDLLVRMLGELSTLLTGDADEHAPLLERLFPPAYTDDEDKEREYQRLMRDELVASRLAAIAVVSDTLRSTDGELLDEEATVAFMQSINAVRIVLGTMLGITDEDAADAADGDDSPEHQLYTFLSWLLEWTVQALSTSD